MPTIRNNNRATGATQGILAAKRIVDMSDRILLLEPASAPLTVLLQKLDKASVFNSEFKVLKDELKPVVNAVNLSAGYSSSATTMVFDNEEYFQVKDIILVPRTGETMKVTAVSATDSTVTVSRSWGTIAAAALVDNDAVVNIGDAQEEGAAVGTPSSTLATSDTNYTQIFRTTFGVTNTLAAQNLYGGDDLAYQARKQGIEHLRKINLASWFGEKAQVTSGGTPIRTTGGVHEHITTNVTDIAGALTALELESFIRSVFRYGETSTRVGIMSREALSAISMLALSHVEMVGSEDTYGIAIRNWRSPHGSINLMVENLFSDAAYLKERLYVLDMSQFGYRFLQGRDTHMITNVQPNGTDARQDEYLTEAGVQRGIEKSSGLLKGIQVV
jgi:hypothetical protein